LHEHVQPAGCGRIHILTLLICLYATLRLGGQIDKSIRDGAYAAMMEAILEDRASSCFFLHYEIAPSPSP
jgi:hypothetical protein